MRSRSGVPCDVCNEPTWVGKSTGRTTARHKSCLPAIEHGTRSGYGYHACRCALCSAWNARTFNEYRRERRAAGNPLPRRGWIAASKRAFVYERDEWNCKLCFEPIDREADPNSNWAASLDHIIPSSLGGSDDVENLRATHRWCNTVRSDGKVHEDLFV